MDQTKNPIVPLPRHVLVGFVLMLPFHRTDEFDPDLNCPQIFTLSDCLSEIIPNSLILNWGDSDITEGREKFLEETGLTRVTATQLEQELSRLYEAERLEYPNLFYSVEDARRIHQAFFGGASDWKIVAFGVPETHWEALSFACAAGADSAEVRGIGHALAKKREMPADQIFLGYDILNLELGELAHSFFCNAFHKDAKHAFGMELNPYGLIESESDATKLAKYCTLNDLGEPGPWFPLALTMATAETSTK